MADTLKNIWLWISRDDLRIELRQLADEGKDSSTVEGEFHRLMDLGDEGLSWPAHQQEAAALLHRCQDLPDIPGYGFLEPSDMKNIRALRPADARRSAPPLSAEAARDRIYGAWLGRCAGCLLGKPVECVKSPDLWSFLKDTGQYPLSRYMSFTSGGGAGAAHSAITSKAALYDTMVGMPVDDDTNYTAIGLLVAEKYGHDFTPADVAQFWLENLPALSTCTAERAAYRNFMLQIQPPHSATHLNPYREWIGAQIRADGFAYARLGDPRGAAEWAWRDASISHVKNGIYGEMFAAALIAAAPFRDGMEDLLRAGLAEIPRSSRLSERITTVMAWRAAGVSYDEAVGRIHAQFEENDAHDWCHTISNAMIVAIALLWGEEDFGLSICRAVQPGFDTDCNGATVGSIMGMRLGARGIPGEWTKRLDNTLHTSLQGNNVVRIDDMAARSFVQYQKAVQARR